MGPDVSSGCSSYQALWHLDHKRKGSDAQWRSCSVKSGTTEATFLCPVRLNIHTFTTSSLSHLSSMQRKVFHIQHFLLFHLNLKDGKRLHHDSLGFQARSVPRELSVVQTVDQVWRRASRPALTEDVRAVIIFCVCLWAKQTADLNVFTAQVWTLRLSWSGAWSLCKHSSRGINTDIPLLLWQDQDMECWVSIMVWSLIKGQSSHLISHRKRTDQFSKT